jgi:hypothetical protein
MPIACNLSVFSPAERTRHDALAETLFQAPEAVRALDDGYAIRLPVTRLVETAEFVSLERLCCPFLTFVLRVEPATDVVWLEMRGSADIKALLASEFNFSPG